MRYYLFHYVVAASCSAVAGGSTIGFAWFALFGLLGPFRSSLVSDGITITPWHVGTLAAIALSSAVVVLMATQSDTGPAEVAGGHNRGAAKNRATMRRMPSAPDGLVVGCHQCGSPFSVSPINVGSQVMCPMCGVANFVQG